MLQSSKLLLLVPDNSRTELGLSGTVIEALEVFGLPAVYYIWLVSLYGCDKYRRFMICDAHNSTHILMNRMRKNVRVYYINNPEVHLNGNVLH